MNSCLARLSGIVKRYDELTALDLRKSGLEVRPQEVLAVLGPNGAGKTTAISLMLGLTMPDEGEVELLGRSPFDIQAHRGIGLMMQEVVLSSEMTVREHIDLIASYYPNPYTVDETLELTNTTELGKRRYGVLSGGQKRQAQFAIALCGRPRLLFLDEPTVGLDVQARDLMWRSIRKLVDRNCSILLTTHYLVEAEKLADRVVVLNKGCVIANGTVNEIRSIVDRKLVRCTTSLTDEQVLAWPEVTAVERDRGQLRIIATDAEAVVRKIMGADLQARDLEIERAGLTEAFVELIQDPSKAKEITQ